MDGLGDDDAVAIVVRGPAASDAVSRSIADDRTQAPGHGYTVVQRAIRGMGSTLLTAHATKADIDQVASGAINNEALFHYAVERTNTLGTVFLGLTVNCAQCHDHKFDPIRQRDYYSMFAIFNNTEHSGTGHMRLLGRRSAAQPKMPFDPLSHTFSS